MDLAEWEACAHDMWDSRGRFADREGMLTARQKWEVFSRMVDAIASPKLDIIPWLSTSSATYGKGQVAMSP